MAKKPNPKPDDSVQSQRFVETAKQLEIDENGKSLERVLKKITPKVVPVRPSGKQSDS